MGIMVPIVLGAASLIVAIVAFAKAAKAEPSRRTRLVIGGVALLLFTAMFTVQIINSLG